MRLATRLWLHGAALPALLLTLALAVVGVGLDRALVHGIDDALRGQAAVEAVSVFDQGIDAPHLHIDRSELVRRLGEPPAATALYGRGGERLLVWPADADLPARLLASVEPGTPPQLATVQTAEGAARELMVPLRGPDGVTYRLLLRRSLAERDAALRAYVGVAALALLVMVLALAVAAGAQARGLGRRVAALVEHVARVGAGELGHGPPPDDAGDEIAALRDAVAEATEARRKARLAEERLLADAAHELRTPLAAMRLELDLSLRRERDADALRETLQSVGEEVDRLSRIAEALLQLDASSRGRLDVPVALRPLVERAAARAAGLCAARGVALQVHALEEAQVDGDADALERALDNLLGNAARFARTRVACTLRADGVGFAVEVADDGPGVPEAEAEAIFAPFHRPDRSAAGAGLGLAIVREVASRHRGQVTLGRAPLGGAAFTLWLPADKESR